MIKSKKYKVSIISSKLKPGLRKAVEKSTADFYLDKKFNWLGFEYQINPKYKALNKVQILESNFLNTKTVYKLNSLNVDLTNVSVLGVDYKYVIRTSTNYTIEALKTELNIHDIVEYEDNYYTNSKAAFYNSDSDFAFTDNVIDIDDCKVTYRSNYIELECPPRCKAIPKSSIFEPMFINEYLFYLPSFYVLDGSNVLFRCIESNIETHQTAIKSPSFSNFPFKLYSKSLVTSKLLNLNMKESLSDLVFKKSTHLFPMPTDKQYFKITTDDNIELSTLNDYVFSIQKVLNLDNIDIIVNNYKRDNYDINKGNLVGVINTYYEVDESINHGINHYKGITVSSRAYHYIKRGDDYNIHIAEADEELDTKVNFIEPKEVSIKNTYPNWLNDITDAEGRIRTYTIEGIKFRGYP